MEYQICKADWEIGKKLGTTKITNHFYKYGKENCMDIDILCIGEAGFSGVNQCTAHKNLLKNFLTCLKDRKHWFSFPWLNM